jgi:hypothetical protein
MSRRNLEVIAPDFSYAESTRKATRHTATGCDKTLEQNGYIGYPYCRLLCVKISKSILICESIFPVPERANISNSMRTKAATLAYERGPAAIQPEGFLGTIKIVFSR